MTAVAATAKVSMDDTLNTLSQSMNCEPAMLKKLPPAELISFVLDTMVRKYKVPMIYRSTMALAREVCADEEYDSPEEQRFTVNRALGDARRAMALTIKRSTRCCGEAPEVRTRVDRRTRLHTLVMQCNRCGERMLVEEQERRRQG